LLNKLTQLFSCSVNSRQNTIKNGDNNNGDNKGKASPGLADLNQCDLNH